MLSRAAGFIAATYALAANGILLPPGVSSIDDPLSWQLDTTKSQVVRIPCSECAFSTKQEHADSVDSGDGAFRIEGGANDILLNFTTSEDSRRLELNGATIYPPQAWSREQSVVVHQVPAGGNDVKVPLEVTSSGLMMDYAQPSTEDGNALVTLRYTVLGLEKQLMQLQVVKVELLKTGDELFILKAEPDIDSNEEFPAPPPPHGPPHRRPHPGGRRPFGVGPPHDLMHGKECNMLPAPVCKFKHMLEAKIARMRHRKPCPGRMGPPHGRLPSHIRPDLPHVPAHGERPHGHHGRPHHMRPWHGHRNHRHRHHHHRHHHFAGAFLRGFVAVLIPVVAGIAVGLTVSLFGLLVGRLLTFFWKKYARKDQQGASRQAQQNASVEEGKGLMLAAEIEDDEVPPAYEDAPAYEESNEKISY